MMIRNWRMCWAISAALFGACGCMPARAQQAPEDRVRAAFLYQLAQYVTWPQEAASKEPFRICVYGYAGFSSTLESAVQGKRIDNRPVRVVSPTFAVHSLKRVFSAAERR